MSEHVESTRKQIVVSAWDDSKKYLMADDEYTAVIVGADATDGEYVISTGQIGPGGFVPEHYHKWEDQTFHVIEGELMARIGGEEHQIHAGDSIHCPRGVTHFMINTGDKPAKLVSYIFPGTWAEEFMAETSRQNSAGEVDFRLIEERFGVVYTDDGGEQE